MLLFQQGRIATIDHLTNLVTLNRRNQLPDYFDGVVSKKFVEIEHVE